MTDAEFRQLREEVNEFLAGVQALPEFGSKRARLPPVPPVAADWQWRKVLMTCEEGDPEAGGWLREVVKQGEPRYAAELPEIDAYKAAVESFAADFLGGAQWSARALHQALRLGGDIRVPPGYPDGFVLPPVARPMMLDPEEALPRRQLRLLGEALIAAANDAVDVSELSGNRDSTWTGAIEAIRLRLVGDSLSSTARARLHRARSYMDAAVNRKLNAAPLEPTDSPRFFQLERERRKRRRTFAEIEQMISD